VDLRMIFLEEIILEFYCGALFGSYFRIGMIHVRV
jgi:hypothetical protein